MRPRVVVKDGRLSVKKSPITAWRPIEIPKCDRCGAIAAWQHPTGTQRCGGCPRMDREAWKAAERVRCDACNVIATWKHPAGRSRCNTCPRPER